jgi:cysteine synthase A
MYDDHAFLAVKNLFSGVTWLKVEGLNPAGSIKLKPAAGMIGDLERKNQLRPGSHLIESSSGNLGVAIAAICAERGYRFTCVVDPNTSHQNCRIIKAFGANVVVVHEKDANGGYLGSRISYIQRTVAVDPSIIWLNQYANPANPAAHFDTTARAISESFERIDYLFVGAGTTGTLMGCRDFFQTNRPDTKIVAVDSVGSVTFGHPPSPRYIPGLGTSRCPEIFNRKGLFALERVKEAEAVRLCRWLARSHGLLAGGSTGTVLAGVLAWCDRIDRDAVVVAISPDCGERYLDTIYSDDWVRARFGQEPLAGDIVFSQASADAVT